MSPTLTELPAPKPKPPARGPSWKHTLATLATIAGTVGGSHTQSSARLDAIEADQKTQAVALARVEGKLDAVLQLHAELEHQRRGALAASPTAPPSTVLATGTAH